MSQIGWNRFFLCLLLCALATPMRPASAVDGVWVRILPASGIYEFGEQIDVEVWIEDVESLYSADVRLAFDAAKLAVVDPVSSDPTSEITPRDDLLSPDFVILNSADNGAGTISYAVTQLAPSAPADGSGALFSFTFQLIDSGTANVEVVYHKLAAPGGLSIPAEAAGATYWIGESYRIFLPQVLVRQ